MEHAFNTKALMDEVNALKIIWQVLSLMIF